MFITVSKVCLTIDGVRVETDKSVKVLQAALDAGIYIPNLCFLPEAALPFGGCRLCFVEIEGQGVVTSCTETVRDGMVVHTTTPKVSRLRRTAAEFIIASHPAECRNCVKNRNCELQKIAAFLKLKLKPDRLPAMQKSLPLDISNPCFILDPNKCVLCGKCIWVCNERKGVGILQFLHRGFDTVVSVVGDNSDYSCDSCMECVITCPVGALLPKSIEQCASDPVLAKT